MPSNTASDDNSLVMSDWTACIIPVYNPGGYFSVCLESIFCQTTPPERILLIDDGARDASPAECDSSALAETSTVVVHRANAGASAARNAGIDLVQEVSFFFVDSDDAILPRYLERLRTVWERFPGYLPCTRIRESDATGLYSVKTSRVYTLSADADALIADGLIGSSVVILYTRSHIDAAALRFRCGKTGDYNEDLLFVLRYVSCCPGVVWTGSADYCYRTHPGSLSRGAFSQNEGEKWLEKFSLWRDFYCRHHGERHVTSMADTALFHLLQFLDALASQTLLPSESFCRLFADPTLRDIVNAASWKHENRVVRALLLKKTPQRLWWFLKFHHAVHLLRIR